MQRHSHQLVPIDLKLTPYKMLVRPKLGYAVTVWDPMEDSLKWTIESVHNGAS